MAQDHGGQGNDRLHTSPRGKVFTRVHRALVLLMSCFGMVFGWPVPGMAVVSETPAGTHFIVLIDDSGDMKLKPGRAPGQPGKSYRDRMKTALPTVLFGNVPGAHDLPQVTGRDRLSVAFFSLSLTAGGTPTSCKRSNSDNSLQPESLFDWRTVDARDMSERGFQEILRNWLDEDCRFQEGLSPIATSQVLSMPFAGTKLLKDDAFTRVIIVTASNYVYNTLPSAEITHLASKFQVRNVETAKQLADEVTQYFSFQRSRPTTQ